MVISAAVGKSVKISTYTVKTHSGIYLVWSSTAERWYFWSRLRQIDLEEHSVPTVCILIAKRLTFESELDGFNTSCKFLSMAKVIHVIKT